MVNDNVMGDLTILLLNIPKNITPIEKLRWVYIKLGQIFCYDYDYLDRENKTSLAFDKDYVGRYQSCIEVSTIFDLVANNIDENIKSKIIARKNALIRGIGNHDHVCNLITLSSGEKYVMDLTLDLYLIQSGCKTKEFGFTTITGDEDIISQYECKEIDEKLGLVKNGEYTDNKIDMVCDELRHKSYENFDSMIDDEINAINNLMVPFRGYQEGKNYINMLFNKILRCNRKEFNLKYSDGKMITCFLLGDEDNYRWFIYDSALKLIETSKDVISQMLESGWVTKSNSLETIIDEQKIK